MPARSKTGGRTDEPGAGLEWCGLNSLEGLSINLATVREQFNLAQAAGLKEAAAMVRANGLRVTGLCRGGMFPAADDAGRIAAIEDNKRAIDEAATLGADCLVLVVGGLAP